MNLTQVSGSFRDPSGFLFYFENQIFRQINTCYREHYELFLKSGLYDSLVLSRLMIPHEEMSIRPAEPIQAYKIIRPGVIPLISYPYEWCFSQLKDAALLTLKIQKEALKFGMSLKDCSAYNVQFKEGSPIFIDTLSFEKYQEGSPWGAYRQFCQHFLAPLALMSHVDIRLNRLSQIYIDGVPLDFASRLLSRLTWFKPGLLMHIHFHARFQKYFEFRPTLAQRGVHKKGLSRQAFLWFIDDLTRTVTSLSWGPGKTEWTEYLPHKQYSPSGLEHKIELVKAFLDEANPRMVWDLGANSALFSRIASARASGVMAFDQDHAVTEKNYRELTQMGERKILPLCVDIANPSPAIGWEHRERVSLLERASCDTVMALALVHHLVFTRGVPLDKIASLLKKVAPTLIIEFIPQSDPAVERFLFLRKDIFQEYSKESFERHMNRYFTVVRVEKIRGTDRILYFMKRRENAN